MNDLPNGTILRYVEAKSSHGVTLSIEQFVEWGVLVPVERCEHIDDLFPNGHIDGHWVGYNTPLQKWCPGAGIGGDDVPK